MELKRAFIETKIKEWNDLFLLNQKFMSNFIFRGQANSEWSLRTSLERLIENHHPTPSRDKMLYYIYESEMIKEFKWKFPSYEKTLSQQAISVLKINIGKEDKLRLTKASHQMNITSETMYPGLDGLAKSVGRLREGLGDYKD